MEFDKEKVKMKIAISKIKEENDVVMENKMKKIFKTFITAILSITLGTGAVFAGAKVYENIWKDPEKVNEITMKITEESKKENITEEQAKEIAINKLMQIEFNSKIRSDNYYQEFDSNICSTNHYKEFDSNKIMYRFITEKGYQITIDGQTGELFDFTCEGKDKQDRNKYITEEQAKELANKYYKIFGFKDCEYEITKIQSTNNEGTNKGAGFRMTVIYCKKYGDIYNPYESIWITLESKNMEIVGFRVNNIKFDNNEVIITEEEAINIALKEDEKVKTNKVESTKAQLMVVKMNADSYDRVNNTEKHYEAMQIVDYPNEERNYYDVEDKVRNAWVVVLNYEDNFNGDIVKRYTEGKYSYFIDATTGEVIGGATMDHIASESVNY